MDFLKQRFQHSKPSREDLCTKKKTFKDRQTNIDEVAIIAESVIKEKKIEIQQN